MRRALLLPYPYPYVPLCDLHRASLMAPLPLHQMQRNELERQQLREQLSLHVGSSQLQYGEHAYPLLDSQNPERKALVIGINAYTSHPLSNCLNDASAVHEALERMGFTSTLILDCDIGTLLEGARSFVNSVMPDDIAFFYFAGHGVEAAIMQAGKPTTSNWLLAREVPESNEDLPRYALDAHNLLAELEARGARFNALVLDCCRNNPLPQHASTRSLGGGGLASMDPKGSLVAFACAPGQRSAELPGSRHGVFTEHLLKHIETRGLELNALFIRVSKAVEAGTSHLPQPQRPYVNHALRIENASLLPVSVTQTARLGSRESTPSRSSAHLGIVIDGDFPDFDEAYFKSKLAQILRSEITPQDISIQPRVGRASSVARVRTGSCEVHVSCSISGRADTSEDAEEDEADRIEAMLKRLIKKLWPSDVTTRAIRVMVSMSG